MLIYIFISLTTLFIAPISAAPTGHDHLSDLERFLANNDERFAGFDEYIKTWDKQNSLIQITSRTATINQKTAAELFVTTSHNKDTVTHTVSVGKHNEATDVIDISYTYKPTIFNHIYFQRAATFVLTLYACAAGYSKERYTDAPALAGYTAMGVGAVTAYDMSNAINRRSIEEFRALVRDGNISYDDLFTLCEESSNVNRNMRDQSDSLYSMLGGFVLPAAAFMVGSAIRKYTK